MHGMDKAIMAESIQLKKVSYSDLVSGKNQVLKFIVKIVKIKF